MINKEILEIIEKLRIKYGEQWALWMTDEEMDEFSPHMKEQGEVKRERILH